MLSGKPESMSRASDLMTRNSARLRNITPLRVTDALLISNIWDEFRDLSRLGANTVPLLLQTKSYTPVKFDGSTKQDIKNAWGMAEGPQSFGPIECSSHAFLHGRINVRSQAGVTGAMDLNIQDTMSFVNADGVSIATVTGTRRIIGMAFLMAIHSMLENSQSLLDSFYDHMFRSEMELPGDVMTMLRMRSLLSGTHQKILASWPSTDHAVASYYYHASDLASAQGAATVLIPQFMQAIAPHVYEAILTNSNPFLVEA